MLACTCVFMLTGDDVKTAVDAFSTKSTETLLMNLAVCGFVYFLCIEVAYAMFDPKTSPFIRTMEDIFRQIVTVAAATFYFQEVVTRNMAIGYGITLLGQLLQSLDQLARTSKQLSVKNSSPKKISPRKVSPPKRGRLHRIENGIESR